MKTLKVAAGMLGKRISPGVSWRCADPLVAHLWVELRSGDADTRAGLLDAGDRLLQVVASGEGVLHELLEGRVTEHVPPGKVGERGRLLGTDAAAKIVRRLDGRSLIVRSHLEPPEPAEQSPRLCGWRASREQDERRGGQAPAADHELTRSGSGTGPGADGVSTAAGCAVRR